MSTSASQQVEIHDILKPLLNLGYNVTIFDHGSPTKSLCVADGSLDRESSCRPFSRTWVSAWVRGFLPLFNRFGQSVPPMLLASTVAGTKQKKSIVMSTMLLFSVSFFAIGFLWNLYAQESWMPALFLLIYALFFMVRNHNLAARSVRESSSALIAEVV